MSPRRGGGDRVAGVVRTEGVVVILLILFLLLAFEVGLLKYMGMRAMRIVSITVSGLTLDQVVAIGTRSSHSFPRRMFGRPTARQTEDGGAEWNIRSRAGVMTVHVAPVSAGEAAEFEVSAWASSARIGHAPGAITWTENQRGDVVHISSWNMAKVMTNVLCKSLNIPHNARKLLSQRRRVLRAIRRAA